jgi:NADH-quinone oxidoreductase subunit L
MVFYGKPRYGETEHPPHESPKAMTIPLIILAALSVVVGLINIPIHSAEHLKKFLEPAFLGADEIKISTIDSSRGGTLALISLLVALAGIGLGIWVYKKRPTSATDEPLSRLGAFVENSRNAFYVNDAVAYLVSGVGTKFANWCAFVVDTKYVDGAARSLASSIASTGKVARRVQTGFVRRYVTIIAASTLVLIFLVILGVNR